jgi:Holliday junction resolvase RusA-like endonuclease
MWLYLARGERLDGDNAWKVPVDGLVKAGVIRSDAAILEMTSFQIA